MNWAWLSLILLVLGLILLVSGLFLNASGLVLILSLLLSLVSGIAFAHAVEQVTQMGLLLLAFGFFACVRVVFAQANLVFACVVLACAWAVL